MPGKTILLSSIKLNPKNPRTIKDARFKQLVKSIHEFPKMLELRPIIVDKTNVIIGGSMRYKALIELGIKQVPDIYIKKAHELTEEERSRFIITDNNPFGEHDIDALASGWDMKDLESWGLNLDAFKQPESTPVSFSAKNKFTVKVICENETQKRELTERLTAEGYKIK